jgi:prepilin-type N-terminal cleavage/methylation domain-containing protein
MNMKRNFKWPHNVSSRPSARCQTRGAFTLVELLVVIAIAAIVTGMTLSGYRSIADGNERVSCQTNLTQIYSAIQLYRKDFDGFYPTFDPSATAGNQGLGLWALYSLPSNASQDKPSPIGEEFTIPGTQIEKPFALYIKNRKQLHCPADSDHEDFFDVADATNTQIDPSFLSYQVQDPASAEWTYLPWRGVADGQWNANRQLLREQTSPTTLRRLFPVDDAVITWCPWHRGKRDIDNVLFVSGAVRPVPKVQGNPDLQTGEPTELEGWNRKPPF